MQSLPEYQISRCFLKQAADIKDIISLFMACMGLRRKIKMVHRISLPFQEQAVPFAPCNTVSCNRLNRRSKPTRPLSPLAAFATHGRTYAVVLIRDIDPLRWALVRLRSVDNPLLNVRS